MTESRARPERIDLAQADDPRDVVHRAVACLAGGGVVGLPTGAGHAVAACALHPEAVARLQDLAGTSADRRLTILLRAAEESTDWAPRLGEVGRRLARRGWPGPLALNVPLADRAGLSSRLPDPVRDALTREQSITLQVPGDGLLREVVRLAPGPVVSIAVARSGGGGTPWDIMAPAWGPLDMVIESRPVQGELSSTLLRVEGERWEVVSAGGLGESEIAAMAGTMWLFVCTGNTCRSPMAESLCKVLLAKRLRCPVEKLVERGYVVMSAGVSASDGLPAAAHAIDAISGRGGSLKEHASRHATPALLRQADLIVTLAAEHLDVVLDVAPEVAGRARLLHPDGFDVLDPIGSDRATYHETAREIETHLNHLLDELGL